MVSIVQYRVSREFSADAVTGFPEINFMVERKDGLIFGKWKALRMFTTQEEALDFINKEVLEDA